MKPDMIFADSSRAVGSACLQERWVLSDDKAHVAIGGTPVPVWNGSVEHLVRCSKHAIFIWDQTDGKPSDKLVDAEKMLTQRGVPIKLVELVPTPRRLENDMIEKREAFRRSLVACGIVGHSEVAEALKRLDVAIDRASSYERFNPREAYQGYQRNDFKVDHDYQNHKMEQMYVAAQRMNLPNMPIAARPLIERKEVMSRLGLFDSDLKTARNAIAEVAAKIASPLKKA